MNSRTQPNRCFFAGATLGVLGLTLALVSSGCSSNSGAGAPPALQASPVSAAHVASPTQNQSSESTDAAEPATEKTVYSAAIGALLRSGEPSKFRKLDSGYGDTSSGVSREVKCAKGVACVGRYVRVGIFGKKRGSCAGVRIARDLVVTNRHCAEVIVETPNSRFNGKMNVSIPEDRFRKRRSIPVSNLVMISPESDFDRSPDWAILKINSKAQNIDEANLPRISRAGIKPGETYTVLTMAPNAKDRNDVAPLEIIAQKCTGAFPNIFFPTPTGRSDAVISLSGCDIGPGDSGSPIYNAKGELVGLIAGQMKPSILWMSGLVANMHGASEVPAPDTFRNAGWGTSFACIPDVDAVNKEIPAACGKEIESSADVVQLPLSVEAKVRATLAVGDIPHPHYRYEVYRSNPAPGDATIAIGSVAFVKVPYCVSKTELQQIISVPISVPAFVASVVVDRDGVPTSNMGKVKDYASAKLELDLEKLKTTGASPMKIYAVDSDFVLYRGTLQICD